VSKAHPNDDQATKLAKKVYAKLEVEFSSKKRERYACSSLQCVFISFNGLRTID
jgi:hypothetical protein